ncbi:MAG: mechanosensitive ion channel family protein [Deltaproteobacteria bacterium]
MRFSHSVQALFSWLLLSLMAVAAPLPAQSPADSQARPPQGAPVVFGTDTLFRLYGRLGPFGPADRAAALERRLHAVARALADGQDSIRVIEAEGRHELLVGDEVLMTVLDADATPAGTTRAVLATGFAARIRQAAAEASAATSLRALILGGVYALVATLALVGVLFLLRTLFQRAYGALHTAPIPALRIKRFELVSASRLAEALTGVARILRIAATIVVLYIYVPLVLSFFPWTAPYSRRIVAYVVNPLLAVWEGSLAYLPKLFFIAVIVVVTRYLLKVIRLLFSAVETGALPIEGFYREWARPTYTIVRFVVIAFAAVVMLPYLPGAGSDAFKGVSVFVGVLFSLGSSGAVANVVAGVVLVYTRAFQIGDRVKIGDTVGDVVERTLLVTRVRTIKNVDITIPNAAVLSSQVINYTTQAGGRGLILHTTATIGYDAAWRQVHQLLIAAAGATEHILKDPAPFVLQTSLDDFYVSYELNAYTDRADLMARTYSDLHQNIQDQFNAAGVEIMSPHYRSLRDGNQVAIPPDQLQPGYRAPAFRVQHAGEDAGGV